MTDGFPSQRASDVGVFPCRDVIKDYALITISGVCFLHLVMFSIHFGVQMTLFTKWPTKSSTMACCLTAPSHCRNQSILFISEVLWLSPEHSGAQANMISLKIILSEGPMS